jgi:hypothetical protein
VNLCPRAYDSGTTIGPEAGRKRSDARKQWKRKWHAWGSPYINFPAYGSAPRKFRLGRLESWPELDKRGFPHDFSLHGSHVESILRADPWRLKQLIVFACPGRYVYLRLV